MSIRFLLVAVAYVALAIATLNLQLRFWVSALSLATVLYVLFGCMASIVGDPKARPFWIGFTVFSFGWLYLHRTYPNPEFYSAPGVLSEYLAGSEEIYYEFSSNEDRYYEQMDRTEKDDFALDSYSGATYNSREYAELRNIYRKRIRYIANCIASPGFGLIGGLLAIAISRNRQHGSDEDAGS